MGADRKPIGFYIASAWLGVCVFLTAFGDNLPITDYKFNDFDAMGVGPFSPNHILGTDFDGVDMLSAIAHGARWSILISFISVLVASLIGGALALAWPEPLPDPRRRALALPNRRQ